MQNFKNSVALYAEIYMSYLYLVNNVRMFTTYDTPWNLN